MKTNPYIKQTSPKEHLFYAAALLDKIERDTQYDIDHEEQDAFIPVRGAISGDGLGYEDGDANGGQLNGCEQDVHRIAGECADEDEYRRYEQSDLQAASNSNLDSCTDLVLHRQHDGGAVLGSITYDRNNKCAYKQLG